MTIDTKLKNKSTSVATLYLHTPSQVCRYTLLLQNHLLSQQLGDFQDQRGYTDKCRNKSPGPVCVWDIVMVSPLV